MSDYANSAKLAADTAFAGRVSQCLVEQARAKLDAAKTANIDPSDLVLAHEVSIAASAGLARVVALMSSDPAFASSYASGPAGDQQSGVTDGQILAAVNAYWHLIATS